MFLFFSYAVTMLIFQIKRIISNEKWCNYVVTFFFLKRPKIWVGWTMLNGEKKEDGLIQNESLFQLMWQYQQWENCRLTGHHFYCFGLILPF